MTIISSHTADILIVGAGLTGLIAAGELKSSRRDVLVIDKSRGVGGRLATRRIGNAAFDHGAQFITARNLRFTDLLKEWQELGLLEEWYRGTEDDHIRWRGNSSMTAAAKHLAKSLNVLLEKRMTALKRDGLQWLAVLENEETIRAKTVLLTAPVPQSLALLDAGGVELEASIREQLEGVEYEPCIAVLAILKGKSNLPQPGFVKPEAGPIAWIADNQMKGISAVPAVTIHATPDFSLENWDADRHQTARALLDAAVPWLGDDIVEFQVHAWRYARPVRTEENPYLLLHRLPTLLLAGDAFGGPRVEGAALSGWAAADALKGNQG